MRSLLSLVLAAVVSFLLQSCSSTPKGTTETTIINETADSPEFKAQVEKVVNSRQKDFVRCYQSLQKRNPAPELKFVAEFRIGTSGNVILSRVHETSSKDPTFQACMLTIVNQLKFPAQKEVVPVRYPFEFEKK